jgi:hypothetical protein
MQKERIQEGRPAGGDNATRQGRAELRMGVMKQ